MKDLRFLTVTGLSIGLLAFTSVQENGIRGTVSPADGADQVLAIAGTDTLKAGISGGSFAFTKIKKGTYTIWVKAKAPYKDALVEEVAVLDSAVTDVGEIKLLQ